MKLLLVLYLSWSVFAATESSPDHIVLTYNPKTNIHVAWNRTINSAPALDYAANLSALYNGATGAAFAFNFETGLSVFIPPGSDYTWYSARKPFREYFQDVRSLKDLYEFGERNGIEFDPLKITDQISDEMVTLMASLSPDYAIRCEALANFLRISKITSDFFKSSLSGYGKVVGDFETPFRSDFKWMVGVYQGLGSFFDLVPNGMVGLVKRRTQLDISLILNAESGIANIIYILKEMNRHFNVGKSLKKLDSQEVFFDVVDKLGGEVEYGSDGFFHLINQIIRFEDQISSITNLRNTIQDFVNDPRTSRSNIQELFYKSIGDMEEALKELKLDKTWTNLTQILNDITEKRWRVGKLDMTQFLTKILELEAPIDDDDLKDGLSLLKSDNNVIPCP